MSRCTLSTCVVIAGIVGSLPGPAAGSSRAKGSVADEIWSLPGVPFRHRIIYGDEAEFRFPIQAMTAQQATFFLLHSSWFYIDVEWKKIRREKNVLSLEGRVMGGNWAVAREAASRAWAASGESCRGIFRPGSIKVAISRAGAKIQTRMGDVTEAAAPSNPHGWGESSVPMPAKSAIPLLRLYMGRAFHETFVHLLTVSAGSPRRGLPVETRHIVVPVNCRLTHFRGSFDLEIQPPVARSSQDVVVSFGRVFFTLANDKRRLVTPLFSRVYAGKSGLEYQALSVLAGSASTGRKSSSFQTSGNMKLNLTSRILPRTADGKGRMVLDQPRFAVGQAYLITANSSWRQNVHSAGRLVSRRRDLSVRMVARVVRAEAPVRLAATIIDGAIRTEKIAHRLDSAPEIGAGDRVVLTGLELDVELACGHARVTWAETSRSRLEALNADRLTIQGPPAELFRIVQQEAKATLEITLSALPQRGAETPLLSREIPVLDDAGEEAGSLLLEIDPEVEPEEREEIRNSLLLVRRKYSLRVTPSGDVPALQSENLSTPDAVTVVWDSFKPVPAKMNVGFEAATPTAYDTTGKSVFHSIVFGADIHIAQISGPRFHPMPAREKSRPKPVPPPSTPLPPPPFVESADPLWAETIEAFFSNLPSGSGRIEAVLDGYADIETRKPRSWLAAALHAEIVRRLAAKLDRVEVEQLGRLLTSRKERAARILILRLLVHTSDDVPRADRVRWIRPLLQADDFVLARITGHFLADIRDPAGVDALIDALRDIESRQQMPRKRDDELRKSLATDLYRLLGRGGPLAPAAAFEGYWKRFDHKLPTDPMRPDPGSMRTLVKQYGAFGDAGSPPIVYVLDASRSMTRKIDWVRDDLKKSLASLRDGARFQIMTFNRRVRTFCSGLCRMSPATLRSANSFLGNTKVRPGTDIHRALEKAFAVRESTTVGLLSDGAPSVGADANTIDRDVFHWNYLRGVRIVVTSFSSDVATRDSLCARLARRHFGWLRVLDADLQDAPKASEESKPVKPVDPLEFEDP